jgi:hypothetical protein
MRTLPNGLSFPRPTRNPDTWLQFPACWWRLREVNETQENPS